MKDALTTIDGVEGVVPAEGEQGEEGALSVRLSCRSSADLRKDIYKKIRQTDWILLKFQKETKSLENIFRELTKEN